MKYRQHGFTPPSGATEVLLVRHGQSRPPSPNESYPMVGGQGDPELSELGREQAIRVGERLRHLPIERIYVTNLRRTVETASPLVDRMKLTAAVEPDLREVHLGDWEGGVLAIKASQKDPIYLRLMDEGRWSVIPGAESDDEVHLRVIRALTRIAERHPDQLVAAFVHGGIVAHILAHATGARGAFAFNADHASISHIRIAGDRIVVRGFNDCAHLVDHGRSVK